MHFLHYALLHLITMVKLKKEMVKFGFKTFKYCERPRIFVRYFGEEVFDCTLEDACLKSWHANAKMVKTFSPGLHS